MDNNSEKLLKHKESLNITFGKFKNDIDNIIDNTKSMIIDVEELEDDIKHCYKKCYMKCFLNKICCFLK